MCNKCAHCMRYIYIYISQDKDARVQYNSMQSELTTAGFCSNSMVITLLTKLGVRDRKREEVMGRRKKVGGGGGGERRVRWKEGKGGANYFHQLQSFSNLPPNKWIDDTFEVQEGPQNL